MLLEAGHHRAHRHQLQLQLPQISSTIAARDAAGPFASTREADEEGGKKTLQAGIAERRRW
jgi:hypothetical protein